MNAPTSVADRKAIFDCIKEISNSLTRIEAERDFIKEAINKISDEHNLSKSIFRRMIKSYHKQNFNKQIEENNDFETCYTSIVNLTSISKVP
jgi:regulator of replication initiation timing